MNLPIVSEMNTAIILLHRTAVLVTICLQVKWLYRRTAYACRKRKLQNVLRLYSADLLPRRKRLLAVARSCEGMANKDLAKFADQIDMLSEKWKR